MTTPRVNCRRQPASAMGKRPPPRTGSTLSGPGSNAWKPVTAPRPARPRRVVRWWLERDELFGGLVGGAEVEAEDGVALECLG